MPPIKRSSTLAVTIMAVALLVTSGRAAEADKTSKSAGKCTVCERDVIGDFFRDGADVYHPDHFRCDHCREVIAVRYISYESLKLHRHCYQQNFVLHCGVCDGDIDDKYLEDYWGNIYHIEHQDLTHCDFCDRLLVDDVLEGSQELPDGRSLCGVCSPSSVVDTLAVYALIDDIATRLRTLGAHVDTDRIDRIELSGFGAMISRSSNGMAYRGFTDYRPAYDTDGALIGQYLRIYLLNGMPRTEMIATIAHELMHVWEIQNGLTSLDPRLSEGNCNYMTYLVMETVANEEAAFINYRMAQDSDPVYGEGFRAVHDYAELHGTQALFAEMRKPSPAIQFSAQ